MSLASRRITGLSWATERSGYSFSVASQQSRYHDHSPFSEIFQSSMRMDSYFGQGGKKKSKFYLDHHSGLKPLPLLHLFLITYLIGSMWAMKFTLRWLFLPVGSSGTAICESELLAPADALFKCLRLSTRPAQVPLQIFKMLRICLEKAEI